MSAILSPEKWMKRVQGKSTFDYYEEEDMSLETALQLMQWYGEYVEKKLKQKQAIIDMMKADEKDGLYENDSK